MGKGNRNSQQRLEKQLANEEKLLAEQKAKQSKKKLDRIVAVTCIVFALLIAAVLVLNVLSETGVFIRSTDAMAQGDIVVDAAMMTFFINDHITNWYNDYYVYVMYGLVSLDMTRDLKTQKLTANDASYMGDASLAGKTWYDYFMDDVIENVEMYITYATAAKAIPSLKELPQEDIDEINETIKNIKDSLKSYKMTIAQQYGKGVTENDIRRCYELIYLAANYGEYLQNETETRLEAEEGKTTIVNYPDENKELFYTAGYLSYTISVSEKTEGSQKAYDAAVQEAKAAAQKIAEAKTPADFAKLVQEYKDSLKASTETSTSTSASTSTETEKATTTEAETKNPAEQYEETIYYETNDELGKWLFDETDVPEVGDVKVIEETSTEKVTEKATSTSTETGNATETSTDKTVSPEKETDADGKIIYEKFKVTVYMVTELPSLDFTKTHNIAYVITDNKDAADAFFNAFKENTEKNSNDKARDIFEELAEAQYNKLFEGHDHEHHEEGETDPVFSYSQYDQAKEKFFADDYDALNKWLDNEARKDGDWTSDGPIKVTVTGSDSKITTYYAILYFEGHDEPAWYVDAFAGATQQAIDDWYKAELAKKLIEYNMDAIDDINIVKYSQ